MKQKLVLDQGTLLSWAGKTLGNPKASQAEKSLAGSILACWRWSLASALT